MRKQKEQLMDKRFEQLARLVGEALAKRWVQVMSKKRPREPHPPRRRRHKPPPQQPRVDT